MKLFISNRGTPRGVRLRSLRGKHESRSYLHASVETFTRLSYGQEHQVITYLSPFRVRTSRLFFMG